MRPHSKSSMRLLTSLLFKTAIAGGLVLEISWSSSFASRKKCGAAAGVLEVDVLAESETHLSFNVTRCRYAEFYRDLGLTDIGFHIHCKRDYAMIDGFNPGIELDRRQTLMEGANYCNFRYKKGPA